MFSRTAIQIIFACILLSFISPYGYAAGSQGAPQAVGSAYVASGAPVYTWNSLTIPGQQSASVVASSSDGTRLVTAGRQGCIYTSTDSGITWKQRTGAGNYGWNAVASSSDGTTLIVAGYTADQYGNVAEAVLGISKDSGATWTLRTNAGPIHWSAVACSPDGKKQVIVESRGYIYTSTNSGASFVKHTGMDEQYWQAVALSSDGTRIIAASSANVFTSTNSGATWTKQTGLGYRLWSTAALSADGATMLAAEGPWEGEGGGYIYMSTDAGATWKELDGADYRGWTRVASSSDGERLVAAADYIYTSVDSGITWTQQTTPGQLEWCSLWVSPDGSKIIVGSQSIYIGSVSGGAHAIDSPAVSSLTKTSATLGAVIEPTAGTPVKAAGVAYGLKNNPDITGSKVSTAVTSGSFSVHVAGLTSNTLYYFRGYVTNSNGITYTANAEFTTIPDAPTALAAVGTVPTGFNAHWIWPAGTAHITVYRFDVATDRDFKHFVAGYSDQPVLGLRGPGPISGISTSVTGLSPGTIYYYRVRAVNAGGTSANSKTITVVTPGKRQS